MLEIMKWPELMDDFDIEMSVPIEADGDVGAWGKGMSLDKIIKIADYKKRSLGDLLNETSSIERLELWDQYKKAA